MFQHTNYRDYLLGALGGENRRTGQRRALSLHIGCQTAYMSQVLKGRAELSLEQAYGVNSFLGHDPLEAHYFMLLVQKERAKTPDLQKYFEQQIDGILEQRRQIKNRVSTSRRLGPDEQSIYYSSWHYVAIHIAVTIPNLQTKQALCEHFGLPIEKVTEVLQFLLEHQLINETDGVYSMGPTHIHIGRESANHLKHQSNWRLKAIDHIHKKDKEAVHYSVVYSLSKKDAQKIHDQILELIEKSQKIVAPSDEEVLYCNVMDFFELK